CWAAGIERLAMLIAQPPAEPRPIAVIPVGEKGEAEAPRIARELRRAGFHVELGYSGNVGRRMKRANKINARVAVILGEDELSRHTAMLRDLDAGTQSEVPLPELAERLAPFR
ncbi:MAG TPA: His/Gly/Thr/Pro-type tRNA ligase C-terminal domain-containing protein, partial [Stellaceae bacterium]|nr:His/Gly/Thr/Pro-type tRNA ligase C-terminal domain-containing protein [Stellaceae bacterium]